MKLQKFLGQPQILGARIVKISKFKTEETQIFKATVKSTVAGVTRCPGIYGRQNCNVYGFLFEYVEYKVVMRKKVADLSDSYTVIFSAIGKHIRKTDLN